ncbi:MAG TPA: hypothetical protein DD400_02370, partial [Rhodospirillaceae bacterium]|nr:hypothetical protein [Rhodospirillaceae bacterium]
LLSTLSEYITDTPQNLLVEDMAPLFGYYFDGGYYPIGGAQCLANLLAKKIIENGGDIRLNTKAEKILLEDGRVTGVLSSEGTSYFAPLVISNGDVVSTLLELVGKEHLPSHYAQKIINLNRGPSAILLSLGLTKTLPLPARVFIHQNHLEFGIGNPSVIDSSLAPLGHSAVTILCLLSESASKDWHNCGEAYTQQKEAFAEKLLCAVEDSVIPDIRQHIVYKEMATPKTFLSFTKAKNGNIYGAARNAWRPELKSPISGLILVGAGTKTGAGIEAVVVSGTHAADLISQGQLNK